MNVPGAAKRGVVTLCDQFYYPGLLLMHLSVQESSPCPVFCYDIGLTTAQRAHAATVENLRVLELPDDPLIDALRVATADTAPLAKPGKRIWPLWICPVLIQHAPAEQVFWLDCDLLVLRDLDALFAMLAEGPVFTPENKAPHLTPNDPDLYRLMPIARAFDRSLPTVNAGVSGWGRPRDGAALSAYRAPVELAARDPEVRARISWHDQGALIWAIQNCGLEHRVLADPNWNLCVDHVRARLPAFAWNAEALEPLRRALPEVKLLHWNGSPPPWLA